MSRHCAFSPDVTAGQSNVILPVRMTSSTREAGSKHISDAVGEAEPPSWGVGSSVLPRVTANKGVTVHVVLCL